MKEYKKNNLINICFIILIFIMLICISKYVNSFTPVIKENVEQNNLVYNPQSRQELIICNEHIINELNQYNTFHFVRSYLLLNDSQYTYEYTIDNMVYNYSTAADYIQQTNEYCKIIIEEWNKCGSKINIEVSLLNNNDYEQILCSSYNGECNYSIY